MVNIDIETLVFFIGMGTIGGFIFILIKAKKWEDFYQFNSCKRYLLGGLCGFIYNFLYSAHNFPNGLMALVSGYSGADFILSIMERMKKDE